MAMKGFMSKMRRQISFHLQDDNPREANDTDDDDDDVKDDMMYEDYVIITKESFKEMSVDGLPSYSAALMEPHREDRLSSTLLTMQNAVTSPAMYPDSQNTVGDANPQTSAVYDIPFQLHPSLSVQRRMHNILRDVDLQCHVFDKEKYSHDFSQENLCLRDLSCNEEAYNS